VISDLLLNNNLLTGTIPSTITSLAIIVYDLWLASL
jgi:hypothetical protein